MNSTELLDRLLEIEIDIENGTRLADKECLIRAYRGIKRLANEVLT